MEDRLRSEFDVDRACAELGYLNGQAVFAASDFLVAREFVPYEPLPPGKAVCAMLILDGLWATQLFREPGGLERMLQLYGQHATSCGDALRRLHQFTLEDHPERVSEVAAELLGTLLVPAEGGRQHYSFAAKFFHWHAPQHLPIVDSRARRAINMLQKACSQHRGVVLASTAEMWGETYVEEYGRWIAFYSSLIRALTKVDRERLLATDRESLPPDFSITNSLLRVLDKVFWHRGSPPSASTKAAPV